MRRNAQIIDAVILEPVHFLNSDVDSSVHENAVAVPAQNNKTSAVTLKATHLHPVRSMLTVVTGMIRAKIIRRPLREAISRGFSALRELRAKGG